jgi:TIR domain
VPHILISYRRTDSDAIAGRIRDRIAGYFGENSVFMDIDSIPFGMDFRQQVQNALMENDVVLAIIGPKWVGATRGGAARIHDEADPVRVEIETALKRGIPVIPVLVGKASMPKPVDLPEVLKDLSFLNAAEVSAGRDFNQHIDRLLRSMESLVRPTPASAVSAAKSVTAEQFLSPEKEFARVQKYSALRLLLMRCGLLFEDDTHERAFNDSFRQRFFWVGQTSMMFGIFGWVVFGATDLLSGVGGLHSIQFRFMFAMPLMLMLFGLSFTRFARRHWQSFFALFAVVGITCMYAALLLVGPQSWFRVEQGTMSFMLFIAFVGMAPFTAIYTVAVGLFIFVVHALYLYSEPNLDGVHSLFYALFVGGSYAVACTTAWVRERSLRSTFASGTRLADAGRG